MAHFVPQNPEVPTSQQGMFNKFNVTRTDGSDQEGGKHEDCKYFVLDLTHDKHAPAAMRAYALSCGISHPLLAQDIEAEFGVSPDRVDTYGMLATGKMIPLGGSTMPPSMKAKDIIREYFGHGDFDDEESYHSILTEMFDRYGKYLLSYHNKG